MEALCSVRVCIIYVRLTDYLLLLILLLGAGTMWNLQLTGGQLWCGIVSLLTQVLLKEILDWHSSKDVMSHLALTLTYCLFDGWFCEQEDGVGMGSPLSPIIANSYMAHFKAWVLLIQVCGWCLCYLAAWSTGAPQLSLPPKQQTSEHSVHDGVGRGRSPAVTGWTLTCTKSYLILGAQLYRKSTHTD